MTSFLFASQPAAGHVNPGLPIVRALVARGHDVRWYTGREHRGAIEAAGARFEPMRHAADPADGGAGHLFGARPPDGREGLAGFRFDLKHAFLDEVRSHVRDLQRVLDSRPADVLVADTGFLAAGMLHELGGPRWATYGITALTLPSVDTAPFGTGLTPGRTPLHRVRNRALGAVSRQVLFRDVERHHQHVRAGLGLPPSPGSLFAAMSPYLYLQSSTPAFEYPRRDLPEQVRFIGPLLPDPPAGFRPPAWWPELQGERSVVLVNQGTVATDLDDLVAPALQALAGEPLLVITTGGDPEHGLPGPVPDNARVEAFVPHTALLPHVDLMITNGGYGGVMTALAHGVPLIVAGTTEEKPEIAARVAWSGAGLDLRTKRPSPRQIADATRTVLGDPRYRRNAERIRDDFGRHDAPREAADLLEELAATGPARPGVLADASGR